MLFLWTGLLCHCAHLVQTEEAYQVSGVEPTVNGARLTAEMLTTEGRVNYSVSAMVYFVAGETETGPYKCLFTAWGKRGTHRSMRVESLSFRTATGQVVQAPKSVTIPFAVGAGDEGWQATYVVPGVLNMDHEKDGDITLDAVVSIRSQRRTERRRVQLTMAPGKAKDVRFETVFDGFRKKGKDQPDFP